MCRFISIGLQKHFQFPGNFKVMNSSISQSLGYCHPSTQACLLLSHAIPFLCPPRPQPVTALPLLLENFQQSLIPLASEAPTHTLTKATNKRLSNVASSDRNCKCMVLIAVLYSVCIYILLFLLHLQPLLHMLVRKRTSSALLSLPHTTLWQSVSESLGHYGTNINEEQWHCMMRFLDPLPHGGKTFPTSLLLYIENAWYVILRIGLKMCSKRGNSISLQTLLKHYTYTYIGN